MTLLSITQTTARRYLLGRQGLWPGRRWQGFEGTAQALRCCEAVQVDPLCVVARNHDLTLHSRVIDYEPEQLDQWLYQERAFFDYGGTIFVYPINELPYWHVVDAAQGPATTLGDLRGSTARTPQEVKSHSAPARTVEQSRFRRPSQRRQLSLGQRYRPCHVLFVAARRVDDP